MVHIDINCDMGESYGRFELGDDAAIFPYITSCNVACGMHGGDPLTIDRTLRNALTHGVQIGAHPAFPDLMGFGRRTMHLPADELQALVKYQIAAVKGMTESVGGRLRYVKPHGALYNLAADDPDTSRVILQAMQEIDAELTLMGMAGSITEQVAREHGASFVAEAFADRRYTDTGRLVSRSQAGAVISDPAEAVQQVINIVTQAHVVSHNGVQVPVHAQTICIHGDNPAATAILQAIDAALVKHNVLKQAFAVQ